MAGRVHVVGAGIAGLSAALAATRTGGAVTLYEAAPQPGGRCRTLRPEDGFAHDNGTHVLFTANQNALGLLEAVGARARWIEPEPDGLLIYDADLGRLERVGLSPWSWFDPARRPRGLTARDALGLCRLSLPLPDRPVGAVIGSGALMWSLVEPLTVAVLNTPVNVASSKRLGVALRQLARPGAGRLLVAKTGLGPDLVEPAWAALHARGAVALTGCRLRALRRDESRVTVLDFVGRSVALGPDDQVVLAIPPHELARLLPGLPVPSAFEAILNVHFRCPGPDRPRFVGLVGSLAQWALVRPDHVSVTVSAAGHASGISAEALPARIWREVAAALRALGLPVPESPPETRVIRERRATIRQAAGAVPQPPARPLANLALAGDWIGPLPATIESAVMSGERAIRALRAPWTSAAARARSSALLPAGGAS
jgi:hypothetical protein